MNYLKKYNNKIEFYDFVSSRLVELREEIGCTQDFISENISMSIGNYSKLERKISKCSLFSFLAVCDLFHITVEEFLLLDDFKYTNKIKESISKTSPQNLQKLIESLEILIEYYKQLK
ncbi:MAG: helix-turn-helix transcriptional regulator [Clostridia bacterium]